jgi:3-hydroxyacyl-[acyl-carrier-protein] dehydratase
MNAADLTNIIKQKLSYGDSFFFIDEITSVDEECIEGSYTFTGNEFFYKDHFVNNPVIPGVILLEMMGQVGMISHIAWLMHNSGNHKEFFPLMTHCSADYFLQVKKNEKMIVKGRKKYLRNNLMRSSVELFNPAGEIAARADALVKIIIQD